MTKQQLYCKSFNLKQMAFMIVKSIGNMTKLGKPRDHTELQKKIGKIGTVGQVFIRKV